ncbi:Serine/threonine-protein kinase SAPK7 [Cocos nucifera]|nr:Serine/threonine-protein kinase SAPK7 [Cocos nucifera]
MEKYEVVKDIGSGNFGVAKLMRNKETKELVAMKCIERGRRIDENVLREIINHRSLRHPNIIRFKESSVLHSRPKSTVGTPAYIAPEILSGREYDGKKVMQVQYKIPEFVHISRDCRQLISRLFVANPARRITIKEIKNHPWFLKNLPRELTESAQTMYYRRDRNAPTFSLQGVEEIMKIVGEARTPAQASRSIPGFGWAEENSEEEEEENQEEQEEKEDEEEDEYDKTVKEVHASAELKINLLDVNEK